MDEPKNSKSRNGGRGSAKNGKTVGKSDSYQELVEAIQAVVDKDQRVGLFTHACPDPDAIASMMGMQWVLQKVFGLESHLLYAGEVSHPQNNSMVNLLSPDLKRIGQVEDPSAYALKILVDTIPEHAGLNGKPVKFDVVIDHHREQPRDFDGILIHRKAGSCASIVYNIMRELTPENDWLDNEADADTKVATGLIAGIMTDTHYMLADDCTELDRLAFNELFEYRNPSFLNQIVFFKRRKFWIDRKATACATATVNEEGYAIVGLGLIPERERDLIADMAEEMVSWANVETAVAFAVVGGDRIEGSVRSLNSSLIVSEFCAKLGGVHGTGGGKLFKGAYQLPLGGFSIDDDEDEEDALQAWEAIKNRETKRISRIINK